MVSFMFHTDMVAGVAETSLYEKVPNLEIPRRLPLPVLFFSCIEILVIPFFFFFISA